MSVCISVLCFAGHKPLPKPVYCLLLRFMFPKMPLTRYLLNCESSAIDLCLSINAAWSPVIVIAPACPQIARCLVTPTSDCVCSSSAYMRLQNASNYSAVSMHVQYSECACSVRIWYSSRCFKQWASIIVVFLLLKVNVSPAPFLL